MAEENVAEEVTAAPEGNLTDQDKWLSALSYLILLIPVIILLVDDLKKRPFQRYHAVQALAGSLPLLIIAGVLGCLTSTVLGVVTFFVAGLGGICGILFILVWLAFAIYWAVKAYQGDWVEIPVVTNFCKNQGWI